MSQQDPTNYVAVGTSGTDLVTKLNLVGEALMSSHKGSTAPSYAEAGTFWIDDSATPWQYKVYDGAAWIEIGRINAATNLFQAYDSLRLMGLSATASGNRWDVYTYINSAGIMEVGGFIDFHESDGSAVNFAGRLQVTGNVLKYNDSLGGGAVDVWTAGNDGTGSGLDADKVDTYEASALLARANHTGTQTISTISDHNDAAHASIATGQIVDQGGGADLKCKIVNIGDWNMDSTSTLNVAHGVTLSKIRGIEVLIRDDADTTYYVLTKVSLSTGVSQGVIISIDGTNIALGRLTGGDFDSTNFDSTSYNRGYVKLLYTE